ncbi:MAG TPA: hypothetical protein VGG45_12415 [Terracidiphilus sp.]|jgi:hypothetical protein
MRQFWLAAAIGLAAQLHAAPPPSVAPAPTGVIQGDFSDPELSPSQWTLVLRPDGTGHFRAEMEHKAGMKEIEAPNIDREIAVSKEFAGRAFGVAKSHNWFNVGCESHLKVAFQGWKTLAYTGPAGHGSCTFNYSRDREIQSLGESMQAVAQTILEGARLEVLLQHDRLGLDKEMEFLTEEFEDGRAQEVDAIHDILERLAGDDEVLERVRKRAQNLLAHSPS